MALLTAPPLAGSTPAPLPSPAAEPGWLGVLATALARALCTVYCSLLVWSILPLAAGSSSQLVMSGSMAPALATGDVVVTRGPGPTDLEVGRIVTVADPDQAGKLRTHRIDRLRADGSLVLRGDNNAQADSTPVARADVHGVAVMLVPWVGLPQVWWHDRRWAHLGGFVLVAGLAVAQLGRGRASTPGRRRDHEDHEDHDTGGGDDAHTDGPTHLDQLLGSPEPRSPWRAATGGRVVRRTATVAVLGLAVSLGAAGTASAAFRVTTSNPGSSLIAANDFNPYRSAALADGPSFLWQLRETGGTVVANATSPGAPATYRGGIAFGQTGAVRSEVNNTAITLSSGYLTTDTTAAGPTNFSVEAWVRTTSAAGGRVMGFGNGGANQGSTQFDRQIYMGTDGKAYFGVSQTTKTVIASPTRLDDGAWHHLVGTLSSGTTGGMRFYVDGALVGTTTATPTVTNGFWRAGVELAMTGWPSAPTATTFLAGSLDELAVYPTALTAARVSAHFAAAQG